MHWWLVKQEPGDYAWADLVKDGSTQWTGVRNFQARNNLRAMRRGDLALFYHSGDEKRVMGIARVDGDPQPDPTAEEGDWVCVCLAAWLPLRQPVGLQAIKEDRQLDDILLVRQPRLSVIPLTRNQFDRILSLAKTRLP